MSDQPPILYSFRRCPYAMRARLALQVSGQRCELREIVLRDKAPEFLETSPKGTVPVLVTADGDVIDESFDVMLWALGRNDPERWLIPQTGTRDQMMALIAKFDTEFKPQLDAYKYASRGEPGAGDAARAAGSTYLIELDERLKEARYLLGGRVSLADMAILPFVRQFANVDRSWFDEQSWPDLIGWLDDLLASPRFEGVMQKYAKWQAGDAAVIFGGRD